MPQFAAAGPSLYHMSELLLLFIVTVHCIQAYALLQSTQQMRRPAESLLFILQQGLQSSSEHRSLSRYFQ